MTALAKDFDYAKNGLAQMYKDVERARAVFDSGTESRINAIAMLNNLPTSGATLRSYIDAQAAANPGTQWVDLKDEMDLLISAFTALRASMEARHAADDAAA